MSSQLINRVVELTNAERAKAGLQPLTLNNQLTEAAQDHSDSMAEDDFFSHTGADGSNVGDRVRDSGYNFATAGENIAAGQTTAEQVVESWMNSPGHRANILNADYTEIGIGYELLENDTGSVNYNHYWTQVFGSPQGGRSSVSDNQTSPTFEDNSKATPSVEEDSTSVLQSEAQSASKAPQMDELEELIEAEVPVTETKKDSQIEIDSNTTDLEASEQNNDSLSKNANFSLFGTDIGNLSGSEDNYDDNLTGSSDNLAMAGSDDAIVPSNFQAYSYSSSSSSGKSVSTDSSYDFAGTNIMKKSWLGTSEVNLNQYESDLMETIYSSDLNSSQQQKMIEALESFF